MPERIRVGIVGASPQSWAAAAHLPALAHLDELTVTAVATTRQESARAEGLNAYEAGCKGCTTYRPDAVTGAVRATRDNAKVNALLEQP